MAKEKFTKGEWIFKDGIIQADEEGGELNIGSVYQVFRNPEEGLANAKLIAAAPELLRSLSEIREWYEKNREKYFGEDTPVCFSKALSVIQKATL